MKTKEDKFLDLIRTTLLRTIVVVIIAIGLMIFLLSFMKIAEWIVLPSMAAFIAITIIVYEKIKPSY